MTKFPKPRVRRGHKIHRRAQSRRSCTAEPFRLRKPCNECGQLVVEGVKTCPNCGEPKPTRSKFTRPASIPLYLAVAWLVGWGWPSSIIEISVADSVVSAGSAGSTQFPATGDGTAFAGLFREFGSLLGDLSEMGGVVQRSAHISDSELGQQPWRGAQTEPYDSDGRYVVAAGATTNDNRQAETWPVTGYEASPPATAGYAGVQTAEAALPAYQVIDSVTLSVGDVHGDVLVGGMSSATPVGVREATLRRIAMKEGFQSVYLYCSEEAFQAYWSESYRQSHPEALQTCYLGGLAEGEFSE